MKELRVVIAGGREFNDFERLCKFCDNILRSYEEHFDQITIVSGNAIGTDRMGEEYSRLRGYNLMVFLADWFKFGKRAGIIRNAQMAEYAISDGAEGILIAFWNGKSRGTKNMIEVAETRGMDRYIDICDYESSKHHNTEDILNF